MLSHAGEEEYFAHMEKMMKMEKMMVSLAKDVVTSALSSKAVKLAMIMTSVVFAQTSVVNLAYFLSYIRSPLVDYGLWPLGISSG